MKRFIPISERYSEETIKKANLFIKESWEYNKEMEKKMKYPILPEKSLEYFLNPEIEIDDIFCKNHVSNNRVFVVNINGKSYILKHSPTYLYSSKEENIENKIKKVENEIKYSEMFPKTFRKIHHVAMKVYWDEKNKTYAKELWQILEYVPGNNISWNIDKQKMPVELILNFLLELSELFKNLVDKNINPDGFNSENIIIKYEENKLNWKVVNYAHYEVIPENSELWYTTCWTRILFCIMEYTDKDERFIKIKEIILKYKNKGFYLKKFSKELNQLLTIFIT